MGQAAVPSVEAARRAYRWCLLFPFVWQAGLAPFINDVGWRPLGLPFPMAWQMAGIVLTSAVIAWVFRCDARTGVDADDAAFLAATADRDTGCP